MRDSSNRRAVAATAAVSRSKLLGIGRVILGVSVLTIGGSVAVIMAIATLHEFVARDVFGVCVAGMVAVFGAQLVRIGYDTIIGRRTMTADRDPASKLWHSDARVYPYLPYSHLDIRGR